MHFKQVKIDTADFEKIIEIIKLKHDSFNLWMTMKAQIEKPSFTRLIAHVCLGKISLL